jgi:hypothetical protein
MQVELSVNDDFAIPPVAKPLGDEVRTVRGWLQGSELFGVPVILNQGVPPADDARSPSAPVVEAAGVSVAIGESENVGEGMRASQEAVGIFLSVASYEGPYFLAAGSESFEGIRGAFAAIQCLAKATGPFGGYQAATIAACLPKSGSWSHPRGGSEGERVEVLWLRWIRPPRTSLLI